jgi:hypothetical protein
MSFWSVEGETLHGGGEPASGRSRWGTASQRPCPSAVEMTHRWAGDPGRSPHDDVREQRPRIRVACPLSCRGAVLRLPERATRRAVRRDALGTLGAFRGDDVVIADHDRSEN